jgi:hypothetical protein
MKEVKRVCIYPKDIMRITGKSERFSRRLLDTIKKHYNKSAHQFVTTIEFSTYTGIDLLIIEGYLAS